MRDEFIPTLTHATEWDSALLPVEELHASHAFTVSMAAGLSLRAGEGLLDVVILLRATTDPWRNAVSRCRAPIHDPALDRIGWRLAAGVDADGEPSARDGPARGSHSRVPRPRRGRRHSPYRGG